MAKPQAEVKSVMVEVAKMEVKGTTAAASDVAKMAGDAKAAAAKAAEKVKMAAERKAEAATETLAKTQHMLQR